MKKLAAVLLFIVVSVMAVSCGASGTQPLVIGITQETGSIPLVIAMQRGYLPENASLKIYKDAQECGGDLSDGVIDGVIIDIVTACLLSADGSNSIVAAVSGEYGIIANNASIASPSDLEEKTIGLTVNATADYVAGLFLEEQGVDVSLVEKNVIPEISSRLALLLRNQIDAVCVPEPYLTAAAQNGSNIIAKKGVSGMLVFSETAQNEKSGEIKSIRKAYDKAVKYMAGANREDFLRDAIEFMELPEYAYYIDLSEYTEMAAPDENEINEAVGWLAKRELLADGLTYEDIVSQSLKVTSPR